MRSNRRLSGLWVLASLSAVLIAAEGCGGSKRGDGNSDAASPLGGSTAQTSQGGASGMDAGGGSLGPDAKIASNAGARAGAETADATSAGGTDRGGSTGTAGTVATSLDGSAGVVVGSSGGKGGTSSGTTSTTPATGGTGGSSSGSTGGAPPPPWTIPAGCGDKKLDASEQCDDGNNLPFDGCSSDCRSEPTCKNVGPCTSKCGDGLVVGEECDDGNTADGDGCSKDCKVEPGFTCAQAPLTDSILLSAVYRDFHSGRTSEFEPGVTSINPPTPGMVERQLDDEGKPMYTGLTGGTVKVTSKESFATWYRDTPDVNHANPGKLRLWGNGDGTYVNRWGAGGERWLVTERAYFCGFVADERLDSNGGKIPCTSRSAATTDCDTLAAKGARLVSCTLSSDGIYSATYAVKTMDGTPSFFPVDGDPFSPAGERQSSVISPPWDTTGTYPSDVDAAGKPIVHNFSFTSEFRSWLRYEAGKSVQLTLGGDDDLWVFINKQLALDLGGIHVSSQGTLVLDDAAATKFGLTNGNVYEIAIFHAERQSKSSILTLMLAGFNGNPSVCRRD